MTGSSNHSTAQEIRDRIVGGEVSAAEVMAATLSGMEALEPTLNAFVTPTPERAMEWMRRVGELASTDPRLEEDRRAFLAAYEAGELNR